MNRLSQLEEIPLSFRSNRFNGHLIFLCQSHQHLILPPIPEWLLPLMWFRTTQGDISRRASQAPISGVPVFLKYKKKEGGEGSGKEEEKGLTPALFCFVSLSFVFSELCSSCSLPMLHFPNKVIDTLTIFPFKINLFLFFLYAYLPMCMYTLHPRREQQVSWNWSYGWFSCHVEPGNGTCKSSKCPDPWAISPVPPTVPFKLMKLAHGVGFLMATSLPTQPGH